MDLKSVYALMDENYLYVAIQIYGDFAPDLHRNYFVFLDFNKDLKGEWDFGMRPDGDTWVFDMTIDKNNSNPEKTAGVVAAGGKDALEIRIPRKEYNIPDSIYVWCTVTEGGPHVDATKWFEVSQIGKVSPAPAPAPTTSISIIAPTTTLKLTQNSNEIELKYDNGIAKNSCSAGGYFFSVKFSPPSTPFTIEKIKLFTNLQGSNYEAQKVEVKILSKDLAPLFSKQKPASEFSRDPEWVTVDVPNIIVNGDFYIYLYTNSKREGGVYIYYDSSLTNQHSDYLMPTGEIAEWTVPNPKDTTNWMIRVIGTTSPR